MVRRPQQTSLFQAAVVLALVLAFLALLSAPQRTCHGASCLFFLSFSVLLFLGLLPLPEDVPLPAATEKILPDSPEAHPRRLQLPPPAAR